MQRDFQQANATTRAEWFIYLAFWPPSSPDLSTFNIFLWSWTWEYPHKHCADENKYHICSKSHFIPSFGQDFRKSSGNDPCMFRQWGTIVTYYNTRCNKSWNVFHCMCVILYKMDVTSTTVGNICGFLSAVCLSYFSYFMYDTCISHLNES